MQSSIRLPDPRSPQVPGGTELAAGVFANDALPEEKAKSQLYPLHRIPRSVMNQLNEEVLQAGVNTSRPE